MGIEIAGVDHLVLNCADVPATAEWYRHAIGVAVETYDENLTALIIGRLRIRLRPTGVENWVTAEVESPGALDICFETNSPIAEVIAHWKTAGITLLEGPIRQSGARGLIDSVYTRDPDGNLVEVARYVDDWSAVFDPAGPGRHR